MSINPAHLRNIIALASDHLRGQPLAPQSSHVMSELWAQLAAIGIECNAMEEAAKSVGQTKQVAQPKAKG